MRSTRESGLTVDSRTTNPLLVEAHRRQRAAVSRQFPGIRDAPRDAWLSLHKYLDHCPERFYSPEAFLIYSEWLQSQRESHDAELRQYLEENGARLSQALLLLAEINAGDWHDPILKSTHGEWDVVRFLDQTVHPAYLRLVEAVFFPLIYPVALFSRRQRRAGIDGLEVIQAADELRRAGMSALADSHDSTVRNGIAHGGITYLHDEIQYRDNKGNTKALSHGEVIALFDDLLDTCNAMALGMRVFLATHVQSGYSVPRQVLLEEVQAATDSPWWHIEACVSSSLPDGRTQLILYARPNTRDLLKVLHCTVASAALAARLAPGLDRYLFSLRTPKDSPRWAVFDGRKLADIVAPGAYSLGDCANALERGVSNLPTLGGPRVLGRVETLVHSLRIHWPLVVSDVLARLGLLHVAVRAVELNRSGWRSVVKACVVLSYDAAPVDQDLIRRSCRRIIRAAVAEGRRTSGIHRLARYLPLGYAQVSVFRRDHRRRKLKDFGLGADRIGMVQLNRVGRIREPDMVGAVVETTGPYRIAWNRSWLDEQMGDGKASSA